MSQETSETETTDPAAAGDRRDRFGVCQWFHYEDFDLLEATVEALEELRVRHLRTGISWADWHRPEGPSWYDWQMNTLGQTDLEVLLSIWHTPPSITMEPERGLASIPPRRTEDFADFVEMIIERHGDGFRHIELWNEPNNPYKWDRSYDPEYERFSEMIVMAARRVQACGKVPVLGGLTLLDYDFIETMAKHGVLAEVEIVGIHAFPDMWEPHATAWDAPSHWYGWDHRIGEVHRSSAGLPVWVTETGLATYDKEADRVCRHELQVERLEAALRAPAERVYWYTLFDLPPQRLAIEEANEGPREEAEYHMGLIEYEPGFRLSGNRKPAYHVLRSHLRDGAEEVGVVPAPAGTAVDGSLQE